MKRLLLAASIATLLLASTSAFAQSHYGARHDQPVHSGQQHRPDRRHDNGRQAGWQKHSQKQSFSRGQRVPVVYLAPRYYVNDYRTYRLAPPPRGYRWVRPYNDSNEYLLVQVTTGVIMQVLGY